MIVYSKSKHALKMNVLKMKLRVREGSIRELVHRFYAAVRDDSVLAPVFANHIEEHEWPAHLERMCDFWSTALLAAGRYHGNPMIVHVQLADARPEHFSRWLELFESTVETVFDPDVAAAVVARAQRMGARLQAAQAAFQSSLS